MQANQMVKIRMSERQVERYRMTLSPNHKMILICTQPVKSLRTQLQKIHCALPLRSLKNPAVISGVLSIFFQSYDLSRLEVSLHNPSRGLHVTMHADTPSHFIA